MRRGRARTERIAGCAAAALCLAAAGASAQSDPTAASRGPVGEAVLVVREAGVLPPGQFEVGFGLDNYDRDPLGIDVVDGTVSMRLGVVRRLELGLSYEITRSVSSPGALPVPSPPLDVVVLDGPVPEAPYRAMYWPMPYLSHHTARVDDMVPGEYTVGARVALFGQRGLRPALALDAQLTGPGTTERFHLSKGSGTGGVDFGVHGSASWRRGRLGVSANLGATLSSDLDPADRFVVVGAVDPVREVPVRRPNLLHAGLGLRWRLFGGVSAAAELAGWTPIGDRTPMQSDTGASELLGGLVAQIGRATFVAGLRWHLSPQPDGQLLATGPLAGAVDLSLVPVAERAALLAPLGVQDLRPDANLAVLGMPPGVALPPDASRIAETYRTSTRGNVGVALRVSLRLGR